LVRRTNFYSKYRDPDANWLTLDVGNFVDRAARRGISPKTSLMFRSYQAMGYDVLGLGQLELAMSVDTLRAIIDTLGIPVVCANVLDARTQKPVARPYYIQRYGNMVIGVTCLVNSDDRRYSNLDTTEYKLLPYLDVARTLIPKLDRKVDAVVLLCDFRNAPIDTLLKVTPQIDVILTTGILRPASRVIYSGNTLLVATGSSGQNGTALLLEFDPAMGDSLGHDFVNEQLTDEYEGENVVSPLVDEWLSQSTSAAYAKKASARRSFTKPAQAKPISPETKTKTKTSVFQDPALRSKE
jgi:2',3'-cyclic-nucleotide 2'-phosphodiesterase (5'-nucleotidase family)